MRNIKPKRWGFELGIQLPVGALKRGGKYPLSFPNTIIVPLAYSLIGAGQYLWLLLIPPSIV